MPSAERETWRREWNAEFAYALQDRGPAAPPRGGLWLASRLGSAARHARWLRWHRLRFDTLALSIETLDGVPVPAYTYQEAS